MENNKKVWLTSVVSPKLMGKEELSSYGKKVQELRSVAEEVAPAGRIVLFLTSEKERFNHFDKLILNLAISKDIYNERGFMRDPTLAEEFSKIAEHMRAINNIIDKRKKKHKQNKRGKNEKTND